MTQAWYDATTVITTPAYAPFIIKESETSYKMWYNLGQGYTPTDTIWYATSTDGLTWSNKQLVVNKRLTANWEYDFVFVGYPCVIKESESSYKMWYQAYGTYDNDPSNRWRILYTTSSNGINWAAPVISKEITGATAQHCSQPFVTKIGENSYKMWYRNSQINSTGVIVATSTNGINWTNDQSVPTLAAGTEGTYDISSTSTIRFFENSNGVYTGWYPCNDGSRTRLMYAQSTDTVTWTNHQLAMDVGLEGTNDGFSVNIPHVVKVSDQHYRMWYAGQNDPAGTFHYPYILHAHWYLYKLSGNATDAYRFQVFRHSDDAKIVDEQLTAGVYDIPIPSNAEVYMVSMKADGELVGYGKVTPKAYTLV